MYHQIVTNNWKSFKTAFCDDNHVIGKNTQLELKVIIVLCTIWLAEQLEEVLLFQKAKAIARFGEYHNGQLAYVKLAVSFYYDSPYRLTHGHR